MNGLGHFHTVPGEFWTNPLSVRGLTTSADFQSPEKWGFVIRSIDTSPDSPRFLVAALRPGQDQVQVTSQPVVHAHRPNPEGIAEDRYYPVGEPMLEEPEVMLDQLEQHIGNHPLAGKALIFLARAAK